MQLRLTILAGSRRAHFGQMPAFVGAAGLYGVCQIAFLKKRCAEAHFHFVGWES